MVKVNVTFNFNPETETISDVLCSVGDVVEVKKTTTKKTTSKKVGKELDGLMVIREEGKLVLSPELIAILEKDTDEVKACVNYSKDENNIIAPFFGKDEAFGTKNGNKLTKSGTIAFRGKNNEILAEFGEKFELVETKPGIYKMVGDKEYVPKNVPVEKAVNSVKDIEVAGDETTEITEFSGFNF